MGQPNHDFAGVVEDYLRASGPAADQLIREFYPQLRELAKTRMRQEASQHSWQPTVLLNELYLELRKVKTLRPVSSGDEAQRVAFLSFAAHLMKRLLIHHSRPISQRLQRVTLESMDATPEPGNPFQEIEASLSRLGSIDPQLRRVVGIEILRRTVGDRHCH